MVTVSVIGCGNMGGALVRGLAQAGYTDVIVCDVDPEALETVSDVDVMTSTDPTDAIEADIVVLAVKPNLVSVVLDDLDLSPEQTVVSIAAGITREYVAEHTVASVVRVMPNLAAEWGTMAGAMTGEDIDPVVVELLNAVGEVVELEEQQMNTATALNGSGPAFVFYLIQAMADAAVDNGIEPNAARILAAQTFKGAAETVIRSDESLDELIDAVCSPKGTTIEGMAVLRESDIRPTLAAAVSAAERRAEELSLEVSDE